MSDRTVPRFALAGLLAAALAAPALAQVANPWRTDVAPMPRSAGTFSLALPPLIQLDVKVTSGTDSGPVLRIEAARTAKSDDFELFIEGPGSMTGQFVRGAGQEFRLVTPTPACGTPDCCKQAPATRTVNPVLVNERDFDFRACPASPRAGQVIEVRQVGVRLDGPTPCCAQACCSKAGPLAGTWVREIEGFVIGATFAGDELKLCLIQSDGSTTVNITLTAEYAITKEGLVHGVITGADTDVKQCPKAAPGSPGCDLIGAEMAVMLQSLVDCPFSFRVKQTSAGVMVSNLKVAVADGMGPKELAMLCGMFKPSKDGTVPTPKPLKPATCLGGMTLPSGQYLDHCPQYFPPDAPIQGIVPTGLIPTFDVVRPMPQPVFPAGCLPPAPVQMMMPVQLPGVSAVTGCGGPTMCPPGLLCPPGLPCPQAGWNPRQAANVPAGEFEMMAELFGQMLGAHSTWAPAPVQPGFNFNTITLQAVQPQFCPPPPCPAVAGMPPCPLQPTVYVPSPQPPYPPAPAPLQAVKPGFVGTWYRTIGTKQCSIKITPDHFTITITEASEIDEDKTMTGSIVLTADYHLLRDGTTAVGLITNVDIQMDGDVPGEIARELLGVLADCQKALEDKPIALNLRLYGDALVIGNVRMPELSEVHFDVQPATLIGGRYKNAGDKPLPKLKPAKPQIINRYSTEPIIQTATPYLPTPIGPGSSGAPVLSTAYSTTSPAGVTPTPYVEAPAAPVPSMVPPTPPGPVEEPKQNYSSDPNERMQQLLYQSQDLGPLQRAWWRFWFIDQPSNLVPERIHGSILP